MERKHFVALVSVLLVLVLLPPLRVVADEPVYHIVTRGQTLSSIARMYNVTVQALVEANNLSDPNLIYVGQRLLIPVPEGEQPDYIEHVVAKGETLFGIAARYGASVWEIASLNGISNLNLIFVGQRLRIPLHDGVAPSVQEAIIITSPASGANVGSPVTVAGWGSAFENTLAVHVLDETGSVLGEGFAMVNAEFGQRGPFTATVTFTPPGSAQTGRIQVYSLGASDGAIEHLNSVLVTLLP